MTTVLGYIASPDGNGSATAKGEWMRGRKPRMYDTREEAVRACRGIEKAGWRDGGQGRWCYIVVVLREDDGHVFVATRAGDAGLHVGGSSTSTLGSDGYVDDALEWLRSRPRRWLVDHGMGHRASARSDDAGAVRS